MSDFNVSDFNVVNLWLYLYPVGYKSVRTAIPIEVEYKYQTETNDLWRRALNNSELETVKILRIGMDRAVMDTLSGEFAGWTDHVSTLLREYLLGYGGKPFAGQVVFSLDEFEAFNAWYKRLHGLELAP